ncbi:HU family DNA-binding protein [Nodularia spumigena]|uniref:HU family DNA-binding protein n=1 Tax=Nodularia spumigena TaxID=70799 RepID=UPI00232C5351|nr:HU family DNA-binding protein [Nodularia spumigena]MDB9318200.1 HU family DNA-binding protein [Nodularia spumigena CS-590/01A]MDB9328025.1 HU family DNA-binding protein [Nodularia spumigena CS-590/02]MDB9334310.1 HU family DNA-binding protein [Nodularia spumigena CS-590/01]
MNTQLVEYIQTSTGFQKNTIESVLNSFVQYVKLQLTQKFSVNLSKFGTFSVRFLDEREGRNPKTGEALTIPGKWKPRFKFSPDFIVQPDPVAEFEVKEPKIWQIQIDNKPIEVPENKLKDYSVTKNTAVWSGETGWKLAKDIPELEYLF